MVRFTQLARWPHRALRTRRILPAYFLHPAPWTASNPADLSRRIAAVRGLTSRSKWSPKLARCLKSMLDELHGQLAIHYQWEEQACESGEVTAAGFALRELHGEHATLASDLGALASSPFLTGTAPSDVGQWPSFCQRLCDLLDALEHHERREDLLVLEAFVDDMRGT